MKTFSKDFLRGFTDKLNIIETKMVDDNSRWTNLYRRVFEFEGKFYETFFERGKSENQFVSMYENDPDEIECAEVFKKEKTVIVYE